MDGIHDLGGREGFGPVEAEAGEPVFHFDWERRVWGLTMGTFVAGLSNGGQFRHSIERMDPVHYLTSRYYEHWMTGVATRAVETGVVDHGELEERAGGRFPLSRPPLTDGSDAAPSVDDERHAVGDQVRVRMIATRGHTRCPAYVRGRRGTVVRVDPAASVPDVEAHSDDRRIETIYSVRFEASELWGQASSSKDVVCVDLWHSYLEKV